MRRGGWSFCRPPAPVPISGAASDRHDSKYSNAVVALKIETGEVAWSFQTSHHDLWDYDVASQPTLGKVTYQGKTVDAVLQPTKQGLLFTLDRETGRPVIPVEERKVPQGRGAGRQAVADTAFSDRAAAACGP